jgi:hypothetical protein
MENSEKYNFSDFTYSEYSGLISLAKKNFTFKNFQTFDFSQRDIIWRHDIDMSPFLALQLAKIEAKHSVQSVYFLLLHSEFYNPLDVQNRKYINEIISLGHSVELHFDPKFYNINSESELDKYIEFEKSILEITFDIDVNVFSFHNNTGFTLNCENGSYGGLLNVYSKTFKKIPYCSDSNGYWRYQRLKDVLSDAEDYNLQILTHEVWWTKEIMSPNQKIEDCIKKHSNSTYKNYVELAEKMNLINIDWE